MPSALETVAIGALVLAAPSMSFAAAEPQSTQKPSASTQAELARIVTEQLDAIGRGDMQAYGKDMADELLYIPSDGSVFSKPQILERTLRFHDAGVGKKFEPLEDVRVIENGNSAILMARVVEHMYYRGTDIVGRYQRTQHFVRRDGRWQATLIQFTEIPENHLPRASVPAEMLRRYVGRYALTDGLINRITEEDGKLMSCFRRACTKNELVPLSDSRFRTAGDSGDVIFVTDFTGRATHYVYRYPDGQEIIATRLAD